MSEMSELIDVYNAAQAEQSTRLTAIYDLFKSRTGYKYLRFSTGVVWSPGLNGDRRVELPQQLDKLSAIINEYV